MGTPFFEPTISCQKVAAAAGTTIEETLAKADKNNAIHTMTVGSTAIVKNLYRDGQMDGIPDISPKDIPDLLFGGIEC
jgi:uncharacterized protein (UPF0261 family)